MALRQPSATLAGTRISLTLPDDAAADDLRSQGGSRIVVRLTDGTEVPARLTGGVGPMLHAEAEWDPSTPVPGAGQDLAVAWSEINDLATVGARVHRSGPTWMELSCDWPPTRVQRRAFRRCAIDLPVWIVRTTQVDTAIVEGRTHDISGSGLAVRAGWSDVQTGEPVVVMLRCPDRDLVLPAVVHWVRPHSSVFGLRFERITQSDQDHLVHLVLVTETVRT